MSNKLKKVFSNEDIKIMEEINFKDFESYNKFLDALNKVQDEGKTVKVDGITSITTMIQNSMGVYPFSKHEKFLNFEVSPTVDNISVELDTKYGRKSLIFERYYTKQGTVLQTSEDAIVYLKMLFDKEVKTINLICRPQLSKAQYLKEIVENYSIVLAFFEQLVKPEAECIEKVRLSQEYILIQNMKNYFAESILRFKKLDFLEQELGITFNPNKLTQDIETWRDVEEVYLLLKEKRVIRLNAKLEATETTMLSINKQMGKIEIGQQIDFTYVNKVSYSLWEHDFTLYTATLLSNAIVKEIKKTENGKVSILYGDEDSRPMYISYRGFKTEDEAKKEKERILDHRQIYADALTVGDYISKNNL